jgi:hypothetical protein
MKKLFLLTAFLIFACSSDDSSNNDDNSNNYKLVETYQYSYVNNDPNSNNFGNLYEGTISYSYDGNKLLNITISNNDGSGTVNYTYNENNKISGVYFAGGDVGEAEYDNQGRLVTWTYTDVDDYPIGNPFISVANFVYNQDGSVVQTWQGGQSNTYLFDQNGNITTIINPDAWDGNTEKNYTYDNKNNPFKNISGNGFFINIWFQGLNLYPSINNNIVTAENENNIFFYTYDEDDYPISFNSPNGFNYKSNIQVNITYTN